MKKERLLELCGGRIRQIFSRAALDFENVWELRFRADKPLALRIGPEEYFLTEGGAATRNPGAAFCPNAGEIDELAGIMSGHSLYAYEDELRNGFITLPGGHRLGICGRAVVEAGRVRSFKHLSALCLRVCREVKGCADGVIKSVVSPGLKHTLIISPPARGKTTLLRDIIRQLSDGGFTAGVVDERSELAGSYLGVPQNDVGIRTDVMDGAPKAEGMLTLLRSMSPEVIAVDEIGREDEARAIEEIMSAGVKLICTAHGNSAADVASRPGLAGLMAKNAFELFIVLSGAGRPGEIKEVINRREDI